MKTLKGHNKDFELKIKGGRHIKQEHEEIAYINIKDMQRGKIIQMNPNQLNVEL